MKILKALKSFICYGSVYFTAIASFMLILVADKPEKAPEASRFLLFLMLSFIFALGSILYRIEIINRPFAACLHAAIYNLGFLLFMVLCDMGFAKSIIGTLIFAIVYTVITVTYRLIAKALKKSGAKNKTDCTEAVVSTTKKQKKSQNNETNRQTEYKNLFS